MNRDKPTADTYNETRRQIAGYVLLHPLATWLRPSDRMMLQALAEGEDRSSWSFLSFDLRKVATEVTFSIESCLVDPRADYTRDEAGNDYLAYDLSLATLNWPCHGSTDVGTCIARARFYEEAALMALDIRSSFRQTGLWRLAQTPQQRKEDEERTERRRLADLVAKVVSDNRKGMKVGGNKRIAQAIEGLPAARYEHTFQDGHRYSLDVGEPGLAQYVFLSRWE